MGTVQLVPSQDCSFTGVDSQELSDGRGRFLPASRSHQLYDAEACECEIIEGRTLGPSGRVWGKLCHCNFINLRLFTSDRAPRTHVQ